jgi:hypothetical protein
MEQKILEKLKMVQLGDLIHIIKFLLALLPSFFFKMKHRDLWLICDYEMEARDNPYWLFRYIRETHPEQEVVYAINYSSPDYERVAVLGPTVPYGSLKHWIYYLAASKNISSQKGGKPNAAVCYLLEVYGIWKNTRIFLQHGIIKDDLSYLYYKNTKMKMFVCSVPREYEFVRDTYGYPKGYVKLLGLCRYDNLFPVESKEKILLVMPTWRKWIAHTVADSVEAFENFNDTDFAKSWKKFLAAPELQELLNRENMKLVFYLHRNMQKFAPYFMALSEQATIAVWPDYDCQQLLKEARCLVTDYSSVAMDFAYMRKPVLYYQFDYERFRKGHMGLGYYDYHRDGFGPICETSEKLIAELEETVRHDYQMAAMYQARCDEFFCFSDRAYCKRNYEAIKEVK